jgi:hypothetical protein
MIPADNVDAAVYLILVELAKERRVGGRNFSRPGAE